jgi:hypothetical protein
VGDKNSREELEEWLLLFGPRLVEVLERGKPSEGRLRQVVSERIESSLFR